jgi:hypothetical protein
VFETSTGEKALGTFNTSKFIPGQPTDLKPVIQDAVQYYRVQGYEVSEQEGASGKWIISIHKGNLFKAIVGMKMSLNIEIEPVEGGHAVKAQVGIFGQEAVPTAITILVFWPVLITQIWGMVRQSKLDEEAIQVIEDGLKAHAMPVPTKRNAVAAKKHCSKCGIKISGEAVFCPQCGIKVEA